MLINLKNIFTHIQMELKAKEIKGGHYVVSWVFYGWVLTATIAVLIVGTTLFFVQKDIYTTLANAEAILVARRTDVLDYVNLVLFEKTLKQWDAKKTLNVKFDLPFDPFAKR
jgi:hypothetical protein